MTPSDQTAATPTVDIHSHFFPEDWPDFGARFGGAPWPRIAHTGPGQAMILLGEKPFRPIQAPCWDVPTRLADMDTQGIDLQVISATPVLFAYDRPVDQALYVAQHFNDAALEMTARSEGRLAALCQVPLQDVDASCRELSRAMRAGHRGVQIGNHVGLTNLDDPGIITFLHHCADEGAAVLVHPWDMMARERMPKYMMAWTVGMPAETQLAIVALILSGGFDRLPRSLRLCFAHGGGSFAFLLGRLENAWHNRDVARGEIDRPPSHYLDRFSVDAAVFDPGALRLLVEVMGPERVMLGSDYPFPLGEQRIGGLVREAKFLSETARAGILGGNALAWLGAPATAAA
ncbi:MAG: amidohydrolase family protein [Alphaproteobacteria bacterium]|nr:amidohydrolase family protein [Alphaproteobacteria bacterium]